MTTSKIQTPQFYQLKRSERQAQRNKQNKILTEAFGIFAVGLCFAGIYFLGV